MSETIRQFSAFCRDSWQLAVLLAMLWYGLAGAEDWMAGIAVVAAGLLIGRTLAPMQQPRFSLPGLFRFLGYFLTASLSGGFDIARRALDPRLPLEIRNHEHRFRLPPGQGRTVFTATVSLLPGTLSRALDDDFLLVHSIAGDKSRDLAVLEERIAALFDIRLEE